MSAITIVEQLVGVRFDADLSAALDSPESLVTQLGLQAGSDGTVVAQATPSAGPVLLVREGTSLNAWCRTCGEGSHRYKARVHAIDAWAHEHRCAPLVLG